MIKEHFIQLVDKYLTGTATDAERRLMEEYMTRLESTDTVFPDIENEQRLKEIIWNNVQAETGIETPVIVLPWYKRKIVQRVAVAALLIALAGIGIKFLTGNNNDSKPTVAQKDNIRNNNNSPVVQHRMNKTGHEEVLQLMDGSSITLADKSEVTYEEPFQTKRDITLVGKAYFKVAKDDAKPFTVISGDIATTALGTEFTVTAYSHLSQIVVRLYEGKVVVKPVQATNKRMKKDVYLLPGQEFVYDKNFTKVKSFKLNTSGTPAEIMTNEQKENPSIPQNNQGSWYMFNNQTLAQVLDQLSEMFDVNIQYQQQDVRNIYFTGKYNRTDSLETILKDIGILHKLTINKLDDSTFIITKK
ncbi:FecR family protein [Pinibacter soli]|uniref:FecR family protein n=1 Tax=Pinibacter soli TaxID=3044211 RepID=A0ABT6RFD2_9BACT|nr:FecR family protein [Pinibacter soli]MDI3321250.1 FecR family protein [Pinibacter soli]